MRFSGLSAETALVPSVSIHTKFVYVYSPHSFCFSQLTSCSFNSVSVDLHVVIPSLYSDSSRFFVHRHVPSDLHNLHNLHSLSRFTPLLPPPLRPRLLLLLPPVLRLPLQYLSLLHVLPLQPHPSHWYAFESCNCHLTFTVSIHTFTPNGERGGR